MFYTDSSGTQQILAVNESGLYTPSLKLMVGLVICICIRFRKNKRTSQNHIILRTNQYKNIRK